jgi:ketosteroid isomerase-like protein
MNKENILKEFQVYTNAWVENFNKGNVQYCIDAYVDDARMIVKGLGKFEGKEEIAGFWNELTKKANHIEYLNTNILVIDENTIHLNSDWKMNIGEGIITLEEWVKQENNTWKLVNDCFQVEKQY